MITNCVGLGWAGLVGLSWPPFIYHRDTHPSTCNLAAKTKALVSDEYGVQSCSRFWTDRRVEPCRWRIQMGRPIEMGRPGSYPSDDRSRAVKVGGGVEEKAEQRPLKSCKERELKRLTVCGGD